jgi:hypothetical protein
VYPKEGEEGHIYLLRWWASAIRKRISIESVDYENDYRKLIFFFVSNFS